MRRIQIESKRSLTVNGNLVNTLKLPTIRCAMFSRYPLKIWCVAIFLVCVRYWAVKINRLQYGAVIEGALSHNELVLRARLFGFAVVKTTRRYDVTIRYIIYVFVMFYRI